MLAKLNTLSLLGIEALTVEVEVDVSSIPLPKTMLVVVASRTGSGRPEGCD